MLLPNTMPAKPTHIESTRNFYAFIFGREEDVALIVSMCLVTEGKK